MAQKAIKIASNIAAIILAAAAVWFAFKITVFSSLPESEAKFWVRVSEVVLIVSSVVLAAGILGEFPESEAWKKSFLFKAAKIVVLIGVLGELVGDAGIFEADKRLQELDEAAITSAADSATAALNRAKADETLADNLLQENIKLRDAVGSVKTEIADRGISDGDRRLIRRQLRGNGRRITIVLLSSREPRAYGTKIGEALKGAGFAVFYDDWSGATPPDTGVIFCEVESGDRQIYEALRRADVATGFLGLHDHRPDFCDKPGVEFPIENLIAGLTLGAVTPATVGGRIIPRGSLAGERGPRIFVGQRP